ncbi:MAG: circularly permuted type 2 ATP-grasp protein [Cypionkella sp.]
MLSSAAVPPSSLFDGYQPLSGVPDELVDASGVMRPAWADLIAHMSALSPEGLAEAIARGEQHLADAGVFFRNQGDLEVASRDWPFSAVPVLLPESEWQEIEAGLVQRADLLERVVADLYGANTLIADGHLPASLIAENPEWLHPMVGVTPQSGHFLHFVAFEIGRGPDGRWWVLSDRTDAPSGAGFALENRVATTRVFPELYQQANVHRLAGFFRSFRDELERFRQNPAARGAILTPGPLTDTYYEQAYIARYLGMMLLEGEDLLVEAGQLCLRTVTGLVPIDVLWRRMDGIWADPLELREDSALGTPGLMAAVRQGSVSMVNALGVGVLETQALMAFLPAISEVLTGQDLMLPNVATWWCGQTAELAHVRKHAHRMMIGPAMATRMPYEVAGLHAIGGQMRSGGPRDGDDPDLHDWLTDNAADLMGKELVKLSTTPVYENGRLVPRPMTIRVFLARTAAGWQAMPGGFARIGSGTDTTAISMRNGGSVADVWVMSDKPVAPVSLLTVPNGPFVRAQPDALPSRAADNLFWLGRYTERTEGLLRLLRAYHNRLDEAASVPLLTALRKRLLTYGVTLDKALPQGVLDTVGSAVYSASQIRDRFSVDGWTALKDLEKSTGRIALTAKPGADAAHVMSVMLRKLAGLSGLVHENMIHSTGWQFLTIGRSLERAAMTTDMLASLGDHAGALDLAIEVGDSIMIHRQRYSVFTSRESVIDLLALDESNPRSVHFHLNVIHKRVDALTNSPSGQMTDFQRSVLAAQSGLALQSVETLDTAALQALHGQILDLSMALTTAFMS